MHVMTNKNGIYWKKLYQPILRVTLGDCDIEDTRNLIGHILKESTYAKVMYKIVNRLLNLFGLVKAALF